MSKWVKYFALPLLLAAIVSLLVGGCGEKEAEQPQEPAVADLPGLLADSVLAMKSASSYTYAMTMEMNIEATGGSSPGKVSTTLESTGAADMAANKMMMNLKMTLDEITLPEGAEDMPQDFSAEMYLIEDSLYMKLNIPELGDDWMKLPVTEEMKKLYNLDMVNQQVAPLETATNIEFIRSETIDGSECYVLKVVPDMAGMKEWLESQQRTTGNFDFDEMPDLQDIFKDLSYTIWVAKDSKLMKKMTINIGMELAPAQVGVDDNEFEKMTMQIDAEMMIKGYNEPVSIVLPEEAENAAGMFGS